MRSGLVLLLALAISPAADPAPVEQSAGQSEITASVDVVRLNVAVLGPPGEAVPALTVEDFRVYDNGVEQDVDLIWRPTDTPLHVALLFDASPSIRPWWISVRRAALTFLGRLARRDCPYVLPFAESIGPGRWGRYSSVAWSGFLTDIDLGVGTSLHDALLVALSEIDLGDEILAAAREKAADASAAVEDESGQAVPDRTEAAPRSEPETAGDEREMAMEPAGVTRAALMASLLDTVAVLLEDWTPTHIPNCELPPPYEAETIKAIVLLSDGDDTTSTTGFEDAITAARLANVPVFPVLLGSASRDRQLQERMAEIARATGGLVTSDVEPIRLATAYAEVLAYLRSTYVLSYTPAPSTATVPTARRAGISTEQTERNAPETSWHDVRVELRRPLLRPIVRPGYYR